jgi:hypothetical protein
MSGGTLWNQAYRGVNRKPTCKQPRYDQQVMNVLLRLWKSIPSLAKQGYRI